MEPYIYGDEMEVLACVLGVWVAYRLEVTYDALVSLNRILLKKGLISVDDFVPPP